MGSPEFIHNYGLVIRYPLFDRPPAQSHAYTKGNHYLALCLTAAGWSETLATAKLDSLVQYKGTAHLLPSSSHTKTNRNPNPDVPRSGLCIVDGTSRLLLNTLCATELHRDRRPRRREGACAEDAEEAVFPVASPVPPQHAAG